MQGKYIVVKAGGLETPIAFPEYLVHADVAKALGYEVISAGFFYNEDGFQCFGDSFSLKVKSRFQVDSDLMMQRLGGTFD